MIMRYEDTDMMMLHFLAKEIIPKLSQKFLITVQNRERTENWSRQSMRCQSRPHQQSNDSVTISNTRTRESDRVTHILYSSLSHQTLTQCKIITNYTQCRYQPYYLVFTICIPTGGTNGGKSLKLFSLTYTRHPLITLHYINAEHFTNETVSERVSLLSTLSNCHNV